MEPAANVFDVFEHVGGFTGRGPPHSHCPALTTCDDSDQLAELATAAFVDAA